MEWLKSYCNIINDTSSGPICYVDLGSEVRTLIFHLCEVLPHICIEMSHASKISKTNCCMSHSSEVYIQQQSFTSSEVKKKK